VLGEFSQPTPVPGGVLGEFEVRAPEAIAEFVEPLAEFAARLPRTGGPAAEAIGLIGLLLAGAGLALRRRNRDD